MRKGEVIPDVVASQLLPSPVTRMNDDFPSFLYIRLTSAEVQKYKKYRYDTNIIAPDRAVDGPEASVSALGYSGRTCRLQLTARLD